jgi:hypothetical protein
MDRVDPIRAFPRDDGLSAVTRVADARVRRETPEEAAERRRREAQERQRRQARRAWAEAQRRRVQEQAQLHVVSEDDSDDGRAHVDVRV